MRRILRRCALVAVILGLGAVPLDAQTGPDVTVLDTGAIQYWGSIGDIAGYSLSSTSCNRGDEVAIWIATTEEHPVIGQQMYRLRDGRIEQIGLSWLKHAFCAVNEPGCATCQDTPCATLGLGCADTYGTFLNGEQANLGPRYDVNPSTGDFNYPFPTQGETGDAIFKRLQIHHDDLNPDLNPGALYFGEVQYITTDEPAFGNQFNNVSYRRVEVGAEQAGGGYLLSYVESTEEARAAVEAWKDVDPEVVIEDILISGDGKMMLAHRVTDLGGSQYHYEYALYNMNSHQGARSFSVPVPPGVTVTNIGFHDVDYHSGEPFSSVDWSSTSSGGTLTWETQTFDQNVNANALRWGTTYNFRFDADAPPASATATVGLFLPGPTSLAFVDVLAPEAQTFGASFSANPTSGGAPLAVQFTDLSGGPIDTWSWDFGDGNVSNQRNPLHVYTQPGLYTVTLTIDGPAGMDTVTEADLIDVGAPVHVLESEDRNALAGSLFEAPLLGSSTSFLAGFSASVAYPDLLSGVDFSVQGAVTGDNGVELVQTQIDDTAGSMTVEVVMDLDPLDGKSIPAGDEQLFGTMVFNVTGSFNPGDTHELRFVDGLGAVPVDNQFTDLSGFSFPPVTHDATITFLDQVAFIRSDCDGTGTINLADPIALLNIVFAGAVPPACVKACDFDDSGGLSLPDGILALQLIFQQGAPPPPPFPDPGPDPTPDNLPCL